MPGREDLLVPFGQRVTDHRLSIVGAEHETDGRVFLRRGQLT